MDEIFKTRTVAYKRIFVSTYHYSKQLINANDKGIHENLIRHNINLTRHSICFALPNKFQSQR